MARRPDPFLTDVDNPELTDAELATMRPARDVLPPDVYARAVAAFSERRERAAAAEPEDVAVTIRIEPDTLAALEASGSDWQATVRTLLREVASGRAPGMGGDQPRKPTARRRV